MNLPAPYSLGVYMPACPGTAVLGYEFEFIYGEELLPENATECWYFGGGEFSVPALKFLIFS